MTAEILRRGNLQFQRGGYYCEDLIVYGGLNRGCQVTQGFEITTPDLRHASNASRVEAHNALMHLLSAFSDLKQIQFRWKVDSDYSEALLRYQQETEKAENLWSKTCRNERFYRYMDRMRRRELRRERLHVFLTTEIKTKEPLLISRERVRQEYQKEWLRLRNSYREYGHVIQTALGSDTRIRSLGDFEHFKYYHQFLNPSLADRWETVDNQADTYEQLWDPEASLQELSYPSDNVSDGVRPHGFYADGYYHALLVVKRWPHRTSNSNPAAVGIIHHLTGLPMLDYAVTLNARPLPVRAEINKAERQLKRNTGDYADSARHELLTSARKMERKIERLSQGYTFPFETLMTIAAWAKTYEELDQKLNTIKNAVNSMNGAQTYEPALASSTKKLWYPIHQQEALVDGVNLKRGREPGNNLHYPSGHVAVERIIRGKDVDVIFFQRRPVLEIGRAHFNSQRLRLLGESDDAAVVIGKHDDWLIPQRRIENPLTRAVERIGINQRKHNAPL